MTEFQSAADLRAHYGDVQRRLRETIHDGARRAAEDRKKAERREVRLLSPFDRARREEERARQAEEQKRHAKLAAQIEEAKAAIEPVKKRPVLEQALAAVTCAFRVKAAYVRSGTRQQPIAQARQAACWLMVRRGGRSYPEAGRALKLDHTTVLHACRRIDLVIEDRGLDLSGLDFREIAEELAASMPWPKYSRRP